MRSSVIVVLLLLASSFGLTIFAARTFASSAGPSCTDACLFVSPSQITATGYFPTDIRLYLPPQENISGYEIYLRYPSSIILANNLTEGDLFPAGQAINATQCINGHGTNCTGLDAPNIVHFSQAYYDAIPGGSIHTVFTIHFSASRTGSGPLEFFNSTLYGEVSSSTHVSQQIPFTSFNGIYSSVGLTAFFNVGPSILLANRQVSFDASGTFNSYNLTSSYNQTLSYSWDFGDGGTASGIGLSQALHNFTAPGSYRAALTVTDYSRATSSYSRSIEIVSALGQLQLSLDDQEGYAPPVDVTIQLFNGSQLVHRSTLAANVGGPVIFAGLIAGTYRVSYNGTGVTPLFKDERIQAGWTTFDNVIVTVHLPPPPVYNDLGYYILVGGVIGGIGLGGLAAFRRRGKTKRKVASQ